MKGIETDTAAESHTNDALVSRRQFMQASAGIAAVAATTATATAQDSTDLADSLAVNFSADVAHDPWVPGTATVTETTGDMDSLEYVADDGEVASLEDHGIVLARRPETDTDTPVAHNPVTFDAASIEGDEYHSFPRGVTYDDDADSSTEEVAVEWHNSSHWSTSNATNGSISISEGDGKSLAISASGMASGETVTATLDLSTVGSSDATITEGMSRKFLQEVFDVEQLPSGSSVVFALVASDGTEVTVSIDPSASDTSAVDVVATATGDAQVGQPRVGEVESKQGVTLPDIQQVEIRISEADAAIDLHALNVERETRWQFGEVETVNADDELETEQVETPSGSFSITSLKSFRESSAFSNATVKGIKYDVEQLASALPDDATLAREKSAERYDYDRRVEVVHTFDGPTAYDISRTISKLLDTQLLPSSRYLTVEVATGLGDDPFRDSDGNADWEAVENAGWTSKGSNYSALDKQVEALSGLAVSDETIAIRLQLGLSEEQFGNYFGDDVAVAVGAAGDGGGGLGENIDVMMTVIMGTLGGLAVFFRKNILGLLGR